jgi:predicted transcriptional regulator
MKTSFVEVMGNNPTVRVLDFLIENDRESWSMVEISRNANVGYSTMKLLLPRLIKQEILVARRRIGKINLYGMNKGNRLVQRIYDTYNEANKRLIAERKIKAAIFNP